MNRRLFLQTIAPAALSSQRRADPPAPPPKPMPKFGDGRDWFFSHRFGLFVHWGLYSIPGWHEQHQWRARVPRAEYAKLAGQWNPRSFHPDAWLDLMQEAGMQYICITTKHHDGFCLWDTRLTKFNTMNTPYRRDVIRQIADACHRRRVPLCLYYSVADWNHPNYPNQGRHHELARPEPGDQPDWNKYMEFLRGQVTELCSNYGEIHGFWWDMNVPQHRDPSINALIRKLQPKAVINDRGFDEGDFGTPERDNAGPSAPFERPTEACQSVGIESWGYRKDEDYYSDRTLIRSIDRYIARRGNYLLNLGPTPDGVFPDEPSSIVRRIGNWYKPVRESLEAAEPASHLIPVRNAILTHRERTLYVHLNPEPAGDGVNLRPIAVMPTSGILLNDGRKLDLAVDLVPRDHSTQKKHLRVRNLPINEMSNTVLVLKLEFDRPVRDLVAAEDGKI